MYKWGQGLPRALKTTFEFDQVFYGYLLIVVQALEILLGDMIRKIVNKVCPLS